MAAVSMSRRTIALILAVALAALATIALISYIRGLEDEVFAGSEIVKVFVAKQDIPAGVTGDTASSQGLIEERDVPKKVVPVGAITTLQDISGKVSIVTIYQDEIIVGPRFAAPGEATNVLPIPAGRHAISLQAGLAPAVAGFIQPGDKISLMVQINRVAQTANGTPIRNPALNGPFVRYLLQAVDVLAVGSRVVSGATTTAADGTTAPADQGGCCLLTLALTPQQSEQLVYAILNGQIYLTLLPDKATPVTTAGRTATNLFQ